MPVDWAGDRTESASFTVSGNGPGKDWDSSSGTYVKSFQLDGISQTDLVISAYQSADCWVNGQEAARGITSRERIDITRYLGPGMNEVSCRVNAGYEKTCGGVHFGYNDCDCFFRDGNPESCPDGTFCREGKFSGMVCYVPAVPSFDAEVAQHMPGDILWSNGDGWHYSRLPVTDGTVFLDRPEYYSTGTIYQGPTPWSSGRAHFSKWFFTGEAEGILAASSLLEPDCALNGNQVHFELVDDDWWVFQANVSLAGADHLLCTVGSNGHFNLFDVTILEPSDGPHYAPAALPGSPFSYAGGSGENGSAWAMLPGVPAGLAAAAGSAGEGLSSLPLVPMGLAAASAAGASWLARKRKLPEGSSPLSGFWERVGSMRERFLRRKREEEELMRELEEHKEHTRRWWKAREATERTKQASVRVQRLSGFSNATIVLPGNMTFVDPDPSTTILGVTISQGTASFEDMMYADYYNGVGGMVQWARDSINEYFEGIEDRAVFMGEDEAGTKAGKQAAAFSCNGLFLKEMGEVAYNVGFGLSLAGIASIPFPLAAALIEEAASATIISGGIMASSGIVLKTVGDRMQHDVCYQEGNMECALRADEEVKWNLMEGSFEIATALVTRKAAKSVVSIGKRTGKTILGSKYTEKFKSYIKQHIGLDELEAKAEKIAREGIEIAREELMEYTKDNGNKYFREE